MPLLSGWLLVYEKIFSFISFTICLIQSIASSFFPMLSIFSNTSVICSIAILDAVKSVMIPTVEVHISKVEEREDFRQISYIRLAAVKTITGLGTDGYLRGIDFLIDYLKK